MVTTLMLSSRTLRHRGRGGQCDQPIVGPVGPDGKMMDGIGVMQGDAQVVGFRVEFLYTNRF